MELTEEQYAILSDCIVDPDEWVNNAIDKVGEWAVLEKIEKYRQAYLDSKYLSITIDPETLEETRIENPDYKTRAERDAPLPPTPEQLKQAALRQLATDQKAIQDAGITCSNGIKLQVGEEDLLRWTQLMTGLVAFQPAQVQIRDYDNIIHTFSLAEASQMLAEVFMWGQMFLADTWAKKDAILNG